MMETGQESIRESSLGVMNTAIDLECLSEFFC